MRLQTLSGRYSKALNYAKGRSEVGSMEVTRAVGSVRALQTARLTGQSHLGGYEVEKLPKGGQEALLQLATPEVLPD